MKQQTQFSPKAVILALIFGTALLSANAQAYYDDDYDDNYYDDYYDGYYDDAWLALAPLIIYNVLSEPRVVVHKKYYREGRLIPRYSRRHHHPKKHQRSRSRDHYKYPQHGRHHKRF
jgi:hypothetical protein